MLRAPLNNSGVSQYGQVLRLVGTVRSHQSQLVYTIKHNCQTHQCEPRGKGEARLGGASGSALIPDEGRDRADEDNNDDDCDNCAEQ